MEPPPRIFVGTPVDDKEVLERVLSNKYARRINISVLPEGEGLDFIRTINYNAEQALLNKTTTVSNNSRVMAEVAKVFAIEREINTIEVFDNSHTSGGMPVGAIIVATKYGFIKSQYRIFNIKSADQSDDYSMLREVIERRLHDKTRKNPDLLLIDGGRGHLNAALRVLREHKVDIPCVGIAKGKQRKASKEKFYVPGKRAFSIKDNNAVFRYLQRLRDEAHRFAISSHRRKRIRALPPIDKR